MDILFIANTHLGLYKDIIHELERRGERVIFFEDKLHKLDPFFKKNRLRRLKRYVYKKYDFYTIYWKKNILSTQILSQKYDILLVLSGVSVSDYLISHLKKYNPNIRTILYTWDSCNYYDFSRLLPLFDKCYTFDLLDAENNNKWELLPIFYKDTSTHCEIIYDIFSVGTNHGDRYHFFMKILPQLISGGIKYYIKIVDNNKHISKLQLVKYFLYKVFCPKKKKDFISQIDLLLNDQYGIRLSHPILPQDYSKFIAQSSCILDDQRDDQAGLTARFMWAIANNKKIITTNKWALKYNFVNSDQVYVIDKDNPIMPDSFIKDKRNTCEIPDIKQFRIDMWVQKLLS